MHKIEIKDLSFGYLEDEKLFRNLNFQAQSGDIIFISGKNGSGKSTLLKILCGIIPKMTSGYLKGKIFIDNIDISTLKLNETAIYTSLLFQDAEKQLIAADVESELAFAPENLCLSTDEIKKRIDDSLKLLNISHLKNQKTHSLSYGQKKLVALSSLITLSPYIFLLDEPLSGLSFEYKKTVIELIKYLSEKQKIIFVSSHSNEIKNVSNKAIIL